MNKINKININKITGTSINLIDEKEIRQLADSINDNSLLQPITVKKTSDDSYEIIDGKKRFEAIKLLGKQDIDCIVVEDESFSNLQLASDLSRKDANPINQAKGLQRLMEKENLTQVELANKLGYRQSTIANKIRLLKLPDYIVEAISNGTISERHGRALLKVKDEDKQEIFNNIVSKKYNVAKTEEYINQFYSVNKNKGLCGSYKIAQNTILQAIKMCKDANIDLDYNETEYNDELKIVIRVRK